MNNFEMDSNPFMSLLPLLVLLGIVIGGVVLFVWTVKRFTDKR